MDVEVVAQELMNESYPQLRALLNEVIEVSKTTMESDGMETQTRTKVLKDLMKKKKYWPSIQIKTFFDHPGLVLLTNTYNKTVDKDFQSLYDQCRSVVIDMHSETADIVLSIGNPVPRRMNLEEFVMKGLPEACNRYEVAMEGTYIYVYFHKDKWHLGTTSCPSIDSSFYERNISFGKMFDDAVGEVGGREAFLSFLEKDKAYTFVLIHHQHKHLMDYSGVFGTTEYAKLMHVSTKDRATLKETYAVPSFPSDTFLYKQERFDTLDAVKAVLDKQVYGVISYHTDSPMTLYMLMNEQVMQTEIEHVGHYNPWVNMIHVYQKNLPEFQVKDFLAKYMPNWTPPSDMYGRPMQPVALLTSVFKAMENALYNAYRFSTIYSTSTGRYRIIKEVDNTLPPVIQFHVAQLRNIQVTYHKDMFINKKVIADYVCHHINMKNLRILLQFFATTGFDLTRSQKIAVEYLYQFLQQ